MLARLLNNWPYKLLALAIAIVLRVQIGNAANPQATNKITVPININAGDVPSNLVETYHTPFVTITYSGPETDIEGLSASDIQATVNLSRARPGSNAALPIVVTLPVELRDKVQRLSMTPSGAAVFLDDKQHMVMSVHAEPPTAPIGYVYEPAQLYPATASVDGPESAMKNVSQLVVFGTGDSLASPADLNDVGRIVAVDSRYSQIDGVTVTPAQARVIIPIRKIGAMKSLMISPLVSGAPRYPLRVDKIDVEPEMVVVSGPAPLLAQTSVALTVPIDLTNQSATFRQSVKLDLPSGLSAVQNPSVEVTVHLTNRPPENSSPPVGLTSHDTGLGAIQ